MADAAPVPGHQNNQGREREGGDSPSQSLKPKDGDKESLCLEGLHKPVSSLAWLASLIRVVAWTGSTPPNRSESAKQKGCQEP